MNKREARKAALEIAIVLLEREYDNPNRMPVNVVGEQTTYEEDHKVRIELETIIFALRSQRERYKS